MLPCLREWGSLESSQWRSCVNLCSNQLHMIAMIQCVRCVSCRGKRKSCTATFAKNMAKGRGYRATVSIWCSQNRSRCMSPRERCGDVDWRCEPKMWTFVVTICHNLSVCILQYSTFVSTISTFRLPASARGDRSEAALSNWLSAILWV